MFPCCAERCTVAERRFEILFCSCEVQHFKTLYKLFKNCFTGMVGIVWIIGNNLFSNWKAFNSDIVGQYSYTRCRVDIVRGWHIADKSKHNISFLLPCQILETAVNVLFVARLNAKQLLLGVHFATWCTRAHRSRKNEVGPLQTERWSHSLWQLIGREIKSQKHVEQSQHQ